MRIILLGAPGTGKGTQAKLICNNFNIPHISTGDIFRMNIDKMTFLGMQAKNYIEKGQLVPDNLTVSIVDDRLGKEDCMDNFLLDGFPRNLNQAKALEKLLFLKKQQIDRVIYLDVSDSLITERIVGRMFCIKCGASYHTKFNPPKIQGVCGLCGMNLQFRADDREEIVKKRLDIYNKDTRPLVDYYTSLGMLFRVRGDLSIEDVFEHICISLKAV